MVGLEGGPEQGGPAAYAENIRQARSAVPDRPEKTLRFRIRALAENGRKVVLHLEDDGFGELFESSGKVWEFPVTFEPEEKRSLYDRKYRKNS